MKPKELHDELERLADKATPGPWFSCGVPYYEYWITTDEPPHTGRQLKDRIAVIRQEGPPDRPDFDSETRTANADLIVSLASNLPTILRALSGLEGVKGVDEQNGRFRTALTKISLRDYGNPNEWAFHTCQIARDALAYEDGALDVDETLRQARVVKTTPEAVTDKEKTLAALAVPKVWSREETEGMKKAYSDAQRKHGDTESLFAVAAWLLRHRSSALSQLDQLEAEGG